MSEQLPGQYRKLMEKYPDYMKAVNNLGDVVHGQGPLDDKTAHLIQMAAAIANNSEGAAHSHARRALKAGATADEVEHAVILLTSTLGFPRVSAAMSWVGDLTG